MSDLVSLSNAIADTIKVTDPDFTLLDWDNFKGSDWIASRQNCHQFGEITVITHKDKPTLKLFNAQELAKVFGYYETKGLTRLLESQNFSLVKQANLKEINGLQQIFENQGREINPQGMKLVNYAGFNHAITHSTMEPAKVIRAWVYGNVMPKAIESKSATNALVLTPELEALLSNIFNSFFEMQKQQNENQLKVIKALSDQVAELQKTVNQLTDRNHKLIDLDKIYFTVHEVLEHINKHYKIQNKTGVFTLNDFRVFLLHDVRMIKGSYNPYAKYVNNNYVTHSLKFTEIGIKFVIDEMHKHGLI